MQTIPQTKTLVEKELDVLFKELRDCSTINEEYNALLDRIVKLHKLQVDERPQRVSPDTLVLAGTNLLGILMILSHERLSVITSKAMSLVLKPR